MLSFYGRETDSAGKIAAGVHFVYRKNNLYFLVSIIFRIRFHVGKVSARFFFTENVTGYYAHVQTVSTTDPSLLLDCHIKHKWLGEANSIKEWDGDFNSET